MNTLDIPGYEIIREIGEGGMASVFEAIQKNLDRRVAIKVLSEELMPDTGFRDRFLAEGKTIANLNHPNIMTIYDCGAQDGYYYMTMELISGGTLFDKISLKQLTNEKSLKIIKQVAQALDCAHKQNLVHRDVKPANVLFRDEQTAVLGDFGIAKVLDNPTQMTQVGLAIGTPDYMSPEQAAALPVTSQSDIYSLGVMAFEMLTGRIPYFGKSPVGIAAGFVEDPIPKLPGDLQRFQPLIDRLLAKEPDERFEHANDLVLALENLEQASRTTSAGSGARTEILDASELQSQKKKSSMPLIAASLAVLAIAGGGSAYYFNKTPAIAPEKIWTEPAPELASEIAELLELADSYLEAQMLAQPPGSNAYEMYEEVLRLNPNNPQAVEGVKKVADSYNQLAQQDMDAGKIENSKLLIEEGLRVLPEHEALLVLKETVGKN